MNDIILETKGLGKSFNGNWVLKDVDFDLRRGEIHALVGENGAGKSTFIKMLSGVYHPDAGSIELEGSAEDITNVAVSEKLGIRTVHQEINLVPYFSIYENVFIGSEMTKRIAGIKVIDKKNMRKRSQEVLSMMDIHIDPKTSVAALNATMQKVVQICSVLVYDPKIVIFDEPTAALGVNEQKRLLEIIRKLKERGLTIIYISHKMEEILRISDEVTVMRDGAWVATEPAAEMTMERIIKLMVGRELTNRFPPKDNEIGGVLLEVEGLTAMYSKLRDVSFNVHKGEIVGLAGLDGSGRTEVLENIFGVATRKSGVIRLHGKEVKNRRARDAIKNKFALLTEERRATGIFGILDIQENTTISSLKKYKVKGLYLSRKKMEESTEWSIRAMRIKTPSQDTKIRSLSGGNQQKVILGRWLLTDPEVLLLDEPTRGIDVGAKYEIYQLIINLAKEGKAVIMVSSEMPELLGVCDRILVMSGGRLAGEVDAKATTQEEIMTLAAKYA